MIPIRVFPLEAPTQVLLYQYENQKFKSFLETAPFLYIDKTLHLR